MQYIDGKFITFIIPVYNTGIYLEDCLESILNQTDKDFNIMIVDDGSTDERTIRILDTYLRNNSDYITLVNQKNAKQGAARNNGLKNLRAKTSYIMFLDSDDFLDLRFIEKLKTQVNRSGMDSPEIIFTLPTIYDNYTKNFHSWHDAQLMKNVFCSPHIPISPNVDMSVYNLEVSQARVVYALDFVIKNRLEFLEGCYYEDFLYFFRALNNANLCLGAELTSFYYRVSNEQQTTSNSDERVLDIVRIFNEAVNESTIKEDELRFNLFVKMMVFSLWLADSIDYRHKKELIKELRKPFLKIEKKYIKKYRKIKGNKYGNIFIFIIRTGFLRFIVFDYLWRDIYRKKIAWRLKKNG